MKILQASELAHVYGASAASDFADDVNTAVTDVENYVQEVNWPHALINTAIVSVAACLVTQLATKKWGAGLLVGATAGIATILTGTLLPSFSIVDKNGTN